MTPEQALWKAVAYRQKSIRNQTILSRLLVVLLLQPSCLTVHQVHMCTEWQGDCLESKVWIIIRKAKKRQEIGKRLCKHRRTKSGWNIWLRNQQVPAADHLHLPMNRKRIARESQGKICGILGILSHLRLLANFKYSVLRRERKPANGRV